MTERILGKIDTDKVISDVKNLYTHLIGGGLADLTRSPSDVLLEEPNCTVHRYKAESGVDESQLPLLLVPPLSAPATCFDLRRGCSVAEFFVTQRRPTYLVDYGDLSTQGDEALGLEHWIDTVLPAAIRTVSADAGGRPVHLCGWSLGGIMAVFTQAAHADLPIASVGAVGSPFDFDELSVLEPVRIIADAPGDLAPRLIRMVGGIPGRVNSLAFMFADPVRLMKKPQFVLKMRSNPDVLAQIQAVDAMMDTMEAYPGESVMQMYQDFISRNQLAEGDLVVGDRTVTLDRVDVPVMNIAGDADNIFGPTAAVHHLAQLVPNSPLVKMEIAHGGHMGVLTGQGARSGTWQYLDDFYRECDDRAGSPVPATES